MRLTTVPRAAVDPDAWDAFVTVHPAGWVWQRAAWLDYLALGRTDASVAIVDGAQAIQAIVPAVQPADPHDPQPAPLWRASGLLDAHAAMHAAQRADPALRWRGQPVPVGPAGPQGDGFWTRVIDLTRPEAELWANLRRSSRSPIRRAEEAYTVRVAPTVDGLALLYRQRPDLPQIPAAGWACLARLHRASILRVWEASDAIGDLVGAVGVYLWKGWAYYGAGRDLVGHGVGQMVQWRVIQALKAEGWPHYEVGWEARDGDDEKARGIAHYKAGFGGARWWVETR